MNFIEKALSEKLTGDDFLQAMADITRNPMSVTSCPDIPGLFPMS